MSPITEAGSAPGNPPEDPIRQICSKNAKLLRAEITAIFLKHAQAAAVVEAVVERARYQHMKNACLQKQREQNLSQNGRGTDHPSNLVGRVRQK